MVANWLNNTTLPADVEFVSVVTSVSKARDNYPPSVWFDDVGFSGTVVVDDDGSGNGNGAGTIMNSFGGPGFAYWVAVDSSGNVVQRRVGGITDAQLDAMVELVKP